MKAKNNIDRSSFGGRIYTLREERNLSCRQMSELIFIDKSVIGAWENGKCTPSYEAIVSICKNMKVSADWLLGLTDERNRNQAKGK